MSLIRDTSYLISSPQLSRTLHFEEELLNYPVDAYMNLLTI